MGTTLRCRHKASINAPGGDGNTPLHIACAQGNSVVFNSVISSTEEDVDTHAKNCEGQMLLHSAVLGGSLDIVNFLLGETDDGTVREFGIPV